MGAFFFMMGDLFLLFLKKSTYTSTVYTYLNRQMLKHARQQIAPAGQNHA